VKSLKKVLVFMVVLNMFVLPLISQETSTEPCLQAKADADSSKNKTTFFILGCGYGIIGWAVGAVVGIGIQLAAGSSAQNE